MSAAVAAELPRTLAEFAAAPEALLDHLRASGKGRRLQVEGGRTVVVVDEEVFRKLIKEELRASILASVIEADAGHTMDAKEFFAQLRREQGRA
jgi:hypothetical protein